MYLAIKKIADENDYSAVAFSCWPKLMPLKGMSGCLVNALLNNSGLVAGCEADVLSTVSMLALRNFADTCTALMDLPKFDTGDNSLLLWHCGTAPFDMADEKGVKLDRHYFADYSKAMKDVNEAIRLDPKEGIFYFNRSNIHFQLGNYLSSVADFYKSISLRL